ncbi:hypothetical protein [Brevundimonas sp.]|nr:hypothetical protein [Brevundimonas sp.]
MKIHPLNRGADGPVDEACPTAPSGMIRADDAVGCERCAAGAPLV